MLHIEGSSAPGGLYSSANCDVYSTTRGSISSATDPLSSLHINPSSIPNRNQNINASSGGISMGTTIIAATFRGGVVLGADTRTSMGTFVSNRVSRKITKVSDGIYMCRSGSAADTQAIADAVSHYIQNQIVTYQHRPSIREVAETAKGIVYRESSLLAGLIIAGMNGGKGEVYSIPLGGSIFQQNCALGGSGSLYITGLCDQAYRENMEKAEAIQFVKHAISHAIYRDNSSGGCIRMVVLSENSAPQEIFFPGDQLTIE